MCQTHLLARSVTFRPAVRAILAHGATYTPPHLRKSAAQTWTALCDHFSLRFVDRVHGCPPRRRFFVLQDRTLSYYTDDTLASVRGHIPVSSAQRTDF